MRPRRERWLSLLELARLLKCNLANPASRRKQTLRYIRRVEQKTGETLTRRFGKALYVSVSSVEALLPYNPERLTTIEQEVADLSQRHRRLKRKVLSHASRIKKVELSQQYTTEYLKKMAELE